MTKKEIFITSILGLGLSAQLLSPTTLPKYDKECMVSMREGVSLNMDYSQDSNWQTKTRILNKCIHKHIQQSFNPTSDILVINLSDALENEIRAGINGKGANPVILTKSLMKIHYQSTSDIQIERPTIISKLFGIKNKIIIDDTDTTYEELIKSEDIGILITSETK